MAPPRQLNCGICGEPKVEQRGRLVCLGCNRRYQNEASRRNGPRKRTDKLRQRSREWVKRVRPSGLTHQRVYALKQRYGLTEEEFLTLVHNQHNCCAICAAPFRRASDIHVDHDAGSGLVRGLLCRGCNIGIGLLAHSPDRAEAAASYLRAALATLNGMRT